MTRWRWSTPPGPRAPQVVLVVFAGAPLTDVRVDAAADVVDPEAAAALQVTTLARAADPAWFDGWRGGALRAIATTDLGADLAALDAATHLGLVVATPDAPADLGYLQTAWAVARAMVARGATVVLDAHAHTFWRGAELPAVDAPLDPRRHIRLVFETDSARTDRAHALHTRGMLAFGAPDLVALCGQDDAPLVGDQLGRLAAEVALGAELAAPSHALTVSPTMRWQVIDDRDGLGALLQLNNRARVVVADGGQHLVGVVARLRAGAS
ncbi:MAG: hypothetical protein R3B06_14590 [Kofleriaceae bacterium]